MCDWIDNGLVQRTQSQIHSHKFRGWKVFCYQYKVSRHFYNLIYFEIPISQSSTLRRFNFKHASVLYSEIVKLSSLVVNRETQVLTIPLQSMLLAGQV